MRRRTRNGLSWIGFLLASAGWVVLLAGQRLASYVGANAPASSLVWLPDVEPSALANALLLTGFGLLILGALREGFGALTRFFDAVLGNLAPPPTKQDRATAEFEAAMAQSPPPPTRVPAPPPTPGVPELHRKPPRPPVRPPGVANYTVRDDGTAEVETLLGVRRFKSEKEAREFLGA